MNANQSNEMPDENEREFRQDQRRRQAFIELFYSILDSVREPLVVLDNMLHIIKANDAFYQTFMLKPEMIEGRVLFELNDRQFDIPKLRELLEKVLPELDQVDDYEIEHNFENLGCKIVRLNARRVYRELDQSQLILLAIEDVTEREYYKRHLEELVSVRTAELLIAREEAEKGKLVAELNLAQIKQLQDQLEAERGYLREEIKLEYNHDNIVGQSDGLKFVLYQVEQIAPTNTIVLVLGETGTGKELIARAIHDLSLRKDRALVKINCATLPSTLIESELFGHEKGAFSGAHSRRLGRFEVADDATLFLDEIGELPMELQSKMLRIIQEGEFERLGSSKTIKVDVRIIAATNRNLEEEVRKGQFREDLYYRLSVFPITMPPLRERRHDIPELVHYYVAKISKRMGKPIGTIPTAVMNALENYHWPGNVRELENVIERAVIYSSGPKLHLADDLKKSTKDLPSAPRTMEAIERDYIIQVLEQTKWKVSGKGSASEILGLDRSTLRARMLKLGIRKP